MAKLGVFYGLCPLIDQKSLLGISEDDDNGFVIVTLGKNMAIKYKLLDQKQIHSWSTKDRLTSPIVYDKILNQYIAVFNNSAIRMFGSDCENLDRIKKYKFQRQIYSLLSTSNGETLILYKNGTISGIEQALEDRKSELRESIIERNETIENYSCITFEGRIIVNYLLKNVENGNLRFVAIFLTTDKRQEDMKNLISFELSKLPARLSGHLLTIRDERFELLTLWSDGKLYSMPLAEECKFPGVLLSVVECFNCEQSVNMVSLNETYIALYGADKNQEGASLIIYNIRFQIIQCKQPFKLYSNGSKLFLIKDNILLTVGNHLAVVPYQLSDEKLAALIGSHQLSASYNNADVTVVTEVELVQWDDSEDNQQISKEIPKSLEKRVRNLLNEGLSEILICEQVIPELIEKKDMKALNEAIDYFAEIPDKILINLIKFILTVPDSIFTNKKQLNVENCPLQPLQRCLFLNKILNLDYNDIQILPYLRELIPFSLILVLLRYICLLIMNNFYLNDLQDHQDFVRTFENFINWGSLILDAHYQKFILSKDSEVLELLKIFQNLVNDNISNADYYKQALLILESIKRGKCFKKNQQVSKWYSIEQVMLY